MSRRLALLSSVLVVMVLAACSGGGAGGSGVGGSGGASATRTASARLTIGGSNSTAMQLVEAMYARLLAVAGHQVQIRTSDDRAVYLAALRGGDVDVVPDTAATVAEFLNRQDHGDGATAIADPDSARTLAAMRPLLVARGLAALAPAPAADQTTFAVSAGTATSRHLSALSQLGALGRPLVLAGPADCARRPLCGAGLQRVYGLRVARVEPLGYGTDAAKRAAAHGQADLAVTSSLDASLGSWGLTALADDRRLQPSENVVPLVNVRTAGGADVAGVLNRLSAVLTTADLARLCQDVVVGGQPVQQVAAGYLAAKHLL